MIICTRNSKLASPHSALVLVALKREKLDLAAFHLLPPGTTRFGIRPGSGWLVLGASSPGIMEYDGSSSG